MKGSGFVKTCLIAGAVLVGVAAYSTQALAWGWAAHTYITGKVVHKDKANAFYGSTAPDMFNYAFDNPCLSVTLHDKLHHEFMPVWDNAAAMRGTPVKAAAFGFVAHNDTWGEDSTAHHDGITLGQGEGYVIAKAEQLKAILQQVPQFQALGVPDEAAMTISHELVEDGIDILVTRVDKKVGRKIFTAAKGRTRKLPLLLARTYAPELAACAGISDAQAAAAIVFAESQWRGAMIAYGVMLSQPEPVQVQLMTEQVSAIAGGFLASNGINLPPDADLTPLIQFALTTGMELCKDDFQAELDATAQAMAESLAANGVTY